MTEKEAYAIGRIESFVVKLVRDKYEEMMEEFSDYVNKQRSALVEMGVGDEEADEMIRRALMSGMEQAVNKRAKETKG